MLPVHDNHAAPSTPVSQEVQTMRRETCCKSTASRESRPTEEYEERIIIETLDQGVFGHTAGVKNALGQEMGELLQARLKSRHVIMISLGGVVGTGLFLGTAESLRIGGPLGMVLAYCIVGSVCYAVMQCLGEMICYLPLPGGLIQLAERFVGPSLSFAMGWTILYTWLIVLPAEISAATILIGYWDEHTNPALYITAAIVIITTVNLLGARAFGETEFWLTCLKLLCIICLLVLSVLLVSGVGKRGVIGGRYWQAPYHLINQYPLDLKATQTVSGPLGRFLSLWSVLLRASFSFQGTEIIACIAGETRNPRKILPRCIRTVWIRILVFYLLGTLAISLICPSNEINLHHEENSVVRSPFVIAIRQAGIEGLASVLNVVLIISALSAGCSNLYTSSRALYALSLTRRAPRIFCKTTNSGLPLPALLVGISFSGLAYLCLHESTNQVFEYFLNMTSVAGMMTWACICFIYLRFRQGFQLQKLDKASLPYRSWGQPFLAWYGFVWSILIIVFNGLAVFLPGKWHLATFISSYIGLPFFILALGTGRYISGLPMVRCCYMDFKTGLDLLWEQEGAAKKEEQGWWDRWVSKVLASHFRH